VLIDDGSVHGGETTRNWVARRVDEVPIVETETCAICHKLIQISIGIPAVALDFVLDVDAGIYVDTFTPHEVWRNRYLVPNVKERGVLSCGPATSSLQCSTKSGSMHLLTVRAGDSIYVPPGLPHAIGAGVFIVEVQEPEDMSILLEWKGFAIDGPRHGHLGIGAEKALKAADRHGWSSAELETLLVHDGTGVHTLAAQAGSYFRAEHWSVAGETVLDAGFSILVILSGEGQLTAANGSHAVLAPGLTILTPHNIGQLTITGELTLLRCRPPLGQAPDSI